MGFVRVEPGEVVVAGSQLRAPTLVGVRWPTITAFAADSISRQACSVVAVLTSFYALLASKQTTGFEALAATAAGCGQNYGQMEASITSALSNTESGLTPGAAPGIAVPAAPHTQQIIGLPGTGELDACTQAGSVVSNGPVFFETSCEQFSENLHTMLDNNAQNWGHSYKNAASQLDDYTHATTQALATIAEFWFGAAAAAATGTISLHRVNAQVLAAAVVQLAAGADACWQAYLACCKTCPTPYEFRQAHQDIQVLGQHLATSPNPVVEAQYLQAVEHLCQLYTRTAAAAATYETAISAVLGGESATTTAAATTASDVPTSPPDQIMGPHTSPHITTADNTSRNGSTQTVDQQTGSTDGDDDPKTVGGDNSNPENANPDGQPENGYSDPKSVQQNATQPWSSGSSSVSAVPLMPPTATPPNPAAGAGGLPSGAGGLGSLLSGSGLPVGGVPASALPPPTPATPGSGAGLVQGLRPPVPPVPPVVTGGTITGAVADGPPTSAQPAPPPSQAGAGAAGSGPSPVTSPRPQTPPGGTYVPPPLQTPPPTPAPAPPPTPPLVRAAPYTTTNPGGPPPTQTVAASPQVLLQNTAAKVQNTNAGAAAMLTRWAKTADTTPLVPQYTARTPTPAYTHIQSTLRLRYDHEGEDEDGATLRRAAHALWLALTGGYCWNTSNDNTRKTPDHDPVVGGYDICVALVEHLGYSSKKTVYWVANTGPDSKYIPPGGYIPRTRYGQLAYHITNHDGPASVLSDIGVYDGWIHPADTMLAWWRQQNKHIRLRAIVSIKPMPQDTFNAFARIGNVSIYSGYQPEPADNVALPFTGPNNTPFAPENIPGYTKNRSGPWDSRLCVQEPNLYRKEADFTSSSHLPKSLRVLREEWEMTFPRAQPTTRDIFVDPNMYETARTLTHQHLDYDKIANKDRWHATHATQHDTRRRGRCDGDNPHDLNQRCLYLNAFLNFSVAETLLLGCAHDDRLRMRPTDIITDTGTPDRNITQIRRDTCTGCLQTRQTWETLNTIAPTDYQPLPSEPTR